MALGMALAQFPPDWMGVVKVAAVFLIGQMLEGNFLSPKLVGDRVGLHPVWIMFALLAGGALFGFVGVLIAVPVAAVVGVLVRHLIGRYRDSQSIAAPTPLEPPWRASSLSISRCRRRPMRREDFVVAAGNREALAWIDRWPDWPAPALALGGPPGCGKTHLGASGRPAPARR